MWAQMVRNLPVMQETWVHPLGQEDPLVKGMATYSSILVWRIPWTEEVGTFLVAHLINNLPALQEIQIWSLGWENPLEKEMATHSSIIAWRIPRTEEPGRLQSVGLHELDMT